jgi:hypothetical protein
MRIVARNTVDAEIAIPCAHGCEALHSRQGTMFVGSQLLPDAMSATRRFQGAVGTAPADHGFARLSQCKSAVGPASRSDSHVPTHVRVRTQDVLSQAAC